MGVSLEEGEPRHRDTNPMLPVQPRAQSELPSWSIQTCCKYAVLPCDTSTNSYAPQSP